MTRERQVQAELSSPPSLQMLFLKSRTQSRGLSVVGEGLRKTAPKSGHELGDEMRLKDGCFSSADVRRSVHTYNPPSVTLIRRHKSGWSHMFLMNTHIDNKSQPCVCIHHILHSPVSDCVFIKLHSIMVLSLVLPLHQSQSIKTTHQKCGCVCALEFNS